MDISFFASSLVAAYWNGAATYCRGIVRALGRRVLAEHTYAHRAAQAEEVLARHREERRPLAGAGVGNRAVEGPARRRGVEVLT